MPELSLDDTLDIVAPDKKFGESVPEMAGARAHRSDPIHRLYPQTSFDSAARERSAPRPRRDEERLSRVVSRVSRLDFSPATKASLVDSGLEVVLTGAGGWLGQATLEMLESSFGTQMVSRTHLFASSHRGMTIRSGTRLEVHPLKDLPRLRIGPHLLVHCAFATRERVSQLGTSNYVALNEAITELVVGHVRTSRPIGIVVPSSGAVYLGDNLATNPYGVLKKRDEGLFLDAVQEGSTSRLVIPRLFNLAGPFLNKPDLYVLGSVIRDIVRGGPIQLRATSPVVRSYVHVVDLVDLTFAMMLGEDPIPLEAFDTAGEREIEVGELAELAASVLGQPGMAIQRPPLEDIPVDRYVGDSALMNALANSYRIEMKALPDQIKDTAAYLEA